MEAYYLNDSKLGECDQDEIMVFLYFTFFEHWWKHFPYLVFGCIDLYFTVFILNIVTFIERLLFYLSFIYFILFIFYL